MRFMESEGEKKVDKLIKGDVQRHRQGSTAVTRTEKDRMKEK